MPRVRPVIQGRFGISIGRTTANWSNFTPNSTSQNLVCLSMLYWNDIQLDLQRSQFFCQSHHYIFRECPGLQRRIQWPSCGPRAGTCCICRGSRTGLFSVNSKIPMHTVRCWTCWRMMQGRYESNRRNATLGMHTLWLRRKSNPPSPDV
jgi:hypothetical protein